MRALDKAGLRVETDLRNEKINYKVREHSLAKVPVMLVVGKREAEERTVSIRRLGSQDQTSMTLDEALQALGTRRSRRIADARRKPCRSRKGTQTLDGHHVVERTVA